MKQIKYDYNQPQPQKILALMFKNQRVDYAFCFTVDETKYFFFSSSDERFFATFFFFFSILTQKPISLDTLARSKWIEC